jgi:hypothetical protein
METQSSIQQSAAAPYGGSHERIDQFKAEIAGLDLKAPEDDKERLFLSGAFALMALGVVAILVGYWGASGSAIVAEQIPYLLSGGLLGVGFIIAGAALFVRYSLSRYLRFWLVREIYEQRAQTDRLVESLTSIESLLQAATRPRAKTE